MHRTRITPRTHSFGRRHPVQVGIIRVAVGIWLLILTAALVRFEHAAAWVWPLPLVALLHFGLAAQRFRFAAGRDARVGVN